MKSQLGSEGTKRHATALDRVFGCPCTSNTWLRLGWIILGLYAVLQCVLQLAVFTNHLATPEITRGPMFEAVSRLRQGLPLYPPPSSEFVPLAYAPFFAVLSAAFSLLFGLSAATLRLVAVLGAIGSGAVIFQIVRRETASVFYGLLATGLFGAAYRAFDCYTDYAQPDSWMLFTALLGFYILGTRQEIKWTALAITLLCVSFWFKQQGALFAIAGVLFVTWRDGLSKSIPFWILAALLGPIAFILLGPPLFGAAFIYYTYQVPSAWSTLDRWTFTRIIRYFGRHWAFLAIICGLSLLKAVRHRRRPTVYWFSLPFSLLIGFLGSLDESQNNVYMSSGVWLIVIGTIELAGFLRSISTTSTHQAAALALAALSFALNYYNPLSVYVPQAAWHEFADLIQTVHSMPGAVYMPDVGQLPSGIRLPIPVHWVPLEDLVRGPGRDRRKHPLVREILSPLIQPKGNAYILMDSPLQDQPVIAFLASDYILVADHGDRFRLLRALPGRSSGNTWPRYLYAYKGNQPMPQPASVLR